MKRSSAGPDDPKEQAKFDEHCAYCGESVARGTRLFDGRCWATDAREERELLDVVCPGGDYICRECVELERGGMRLN
jgi:hypothetical protein